MKSLLLALSFIFSGAVYAQYTLIPDANFEAKLIDNAIDSEGLLNGKILTSDISNLTFLDVTYSGIFTQINCLYLVAVTIQRL